MAKDKDYEVGYGKPPKNTRFRKGQSGNPSGKPRKMLTDDELVLRELAGKVTIIEDGKKRRISRLEAIIKKQILLAMKGDPRAFNYVARAYKEAMAALAPVLDEAMRFTLVFEEEEERRRQAERDGGFSADDDPHW